MESALAGRLHTQFPHLVFSQDEPLSLHTYFKLGGPAKAFVVVKMRKDLADCASFCAKQGIKCTVLGGGSNVLVSDQPISGLVIKNMTAEIHEEFSDSGGFLEADSGVLMNMLVRRTLDLELEGLEYFLGLPGTVGGAVYNNSHYMKQLVGDTIQSVRIIDMKTGEEKTLKKEDLHFSYDYSILQETHDVVLTARFALKKGDKTELEQRALDATTKRATTQPLGIPSSGCMFQNATMPDGTKQSAGYLIDEAGLKGTKIGGAMVSDKHANFIINTGNATAQDVEKLAALVQEKVKERFGVALRREVFSIQ